MEEERFYPVGGYAPGNYMCTCCICNENFQGDKRAVECKPCGSKTEIEGLRKKIKADEVLIFGFFSKLRNYGLEFWNPAELLIEYKNHFHITEQREGKI